MTRYTRGALLLMFCMSIVCSLCALFFNEPPALKAMIAFACVVLIFYGCTFQKLIRDKLNRPKRPSLTFLFWLFLTILGALPFSFFSYFNETSIEFLLVYGNPINNIFESASGLSSTGLTMLEDPALHPRTLLLWRSLLQWIGGIGIAIWVSFVMTDGETLEFLYKEETDPLETFDHFQKGLKTIGLFYISATTLLALIYIFLGMPWFAAINHSLTATSTGGFSITSDSFASYGPGILLATEFFIILGALNFFLIYQSIEKRSLWPLLKDTYAQLFFFNLAVGIVLFIPLMDSVSDGDIFNVIAASTTSGLSASSLASYPSYPFLLIIFLMFLGTMTGSTGGGLQQRNLFYILRHLKRIIKNPEYALRKKEGEEDKEKREAEKAFIKLGHWFIVVTVSVFAVGILESERVQDPLNALFDVMSALTNTGLSSGFTTVEMTGATKFIMSFLMITGRLHIYAGLLSIFILSRRLKLMMRSLFKED